MSLFSLEEGVSRQKEKSFGKKIGAWEKAHKCVGKIERKQKIYTYPS